MTEGARQGRVIRRRQLSPRVSELSLEILGTPPFRWHAGQHIGLTPPGSPETRVGPLWYSIASAWDDREPAVLELAIGPGTGGDLLASVGPGAELDVTGPFGKFALPEASGVLLVGVGTGVAPLRAFVAEALLRSSSAPVALVVGARTAVDLLWHEELAALAGARERLRYVPVLSQPTPDWLGRRGYVQQHLAEVAAGLPPEFVVRACGSTAMVDGARSVLAELGVAADRIDTQSYS